MTEALTKVRVPNGLMDYLQGTGVMQGTDKDERPEVAREVRALNWTPKGATGEVSRHTLGWLADMAESYADNALDASPSALRAGREAAKRYAAAYAEMVPEPEPEPEPDQAEPQDQEPDAFEEGRALGMDHAEALDYADSKEKAQKAAEPSQPDEIEWRSVKAPEMAYRGPFLYGGKGTKGTTPQRPVRVVVGNQWSGHLELKSVDSGEIVATPKNTSKIWAAPIPEGWQPDQDQAEDEHQAVNELEHGQPVYHVATGELVGYWTLAKFTPVAEVR